MITYVARRIGQSLIVVMLVTMIVFGIEHLSGDPARAILGIRASAYSIHQFNVRNGYNRALPVQYYLYVNRLVHGNLGFSYHLGESVSSVLAINVPKTALLVGLSYALALVVAVPLGVAQGVKKDGLFDQGTTYLAFVAYSMPVFWLGLLLIVVFSATLNVLPAEAPQGAAVSQILADPKGLVLPVATLAAVTVAQFSRFARSSTIDQIVQEYIRTARMKGMSEWRVIRRHLLRNSLLPIVTMIGLSFPGVLGGAIIVEELFNYPGMGLLFWQAATAHDQPLLMGYMLVVALATVIGNLAADIGYAVLDPRIRYSKR